jgi:pimeloyl-ACP methyl ester carboxylesterase
MTDVLLETYLQPYHDDPGARAALLKALHEMDLTSRWEQELLPQLRTLSTPTLLVWGDSDPYAPLPVGRQLDAVIPQSDFVVVLKTGHYGMEERPEEIRTVIKEFIGK